MQWFGIASGIFWSITYLLLIKRGYQDKACGMPMAALALNISWEFIFSFVHPHGGFQLVINIAWFVLDSILVVQYLRYEPARRPAGESAAFFHGAFLSMLVVSFLTVLLFTREFENYGGYYTAFGQNLLMSILFIRLILGRKDLAGQSLYIGAAKMLGTFCASVMAFAYAPQSHLTVFFAWAILFFDLAYIGLLIRQSRRLGINPLSRW
ncbi:MAG: hypothetical protein JW748_02800 [Anaerolineales bacterium]|nr:hypothetical protein [Anaerolineales bacterium]